MSFGPKAEYVGTIASGATLSAEIDLQRAWNSVYLEIQSMTSNSQINIQGADLLSAAGGIYRRIFHPVVNTTSVQANAYTIASSVSSAFVPIPNIFRYIKIETTATCDAGQSFKVICGSP